MVIREDLRDLRRLEPVSRVFGLDRGKPIDRYYIERFLGRNAEAIRGHVLEIEDDRYTRSFGGEQVTRVDVLHASEGNPKATLVGDLTTGLGIPPTTFDCVILVQTLNVVYDAPAAVRGVHGALRPGGVMLATMPGISQISEVDMRQWGDYWRFTTRSAHQLFTDCFGSENVSVEAHGNVLTACAFLHGLAAEELEQRELAATDLAYQVVICVRAVKRGEVPETRR
jgi:SAM-dependent methyltransferase